MTIARCKIVNEIVELSVEHTCTHVAIAKNISALMNIVTVHHNKQ